MSDRLLVHLIVGDDRYLIDREIERILDGISEFSITHVPAADLTDALNLLRTPAMFDERRAIVVNDAEALTAEAQRELLGYLDAPSPDSILILVSSKPLAKIATAVKKVGKVEDASKGRRNDIFQWLRDEAKARGLKVSSDAFGVLVDAVGEERMALSKALDELSLANHQARIGAEEVLAQFTGRADTKVFAFVDAVASRQTGEALSSLRRLLIQGESPQMLFWTLTRHIRMLLLAGSGSAASVARQLGIQPWRAEKLVRQARGFTERALIDAYQWLAAADHKMKKSEEPEELTLERAVVAISSKADSVV